MTRWIELLMSYLTPWPVGVLLVAAAMAFFLGVIGTLLMFRIRRSLLTVPQLQARMDSLSNSVTLLTDTTEACYRALSTQVEFIRSAAVGNGRAPAQSRSRAQAAAVAPPEEPPDLQDKKSRQRRVLGAARRGDTLAAIAAREDLAETEVALRVHVNKQPQATDPAQYGSLLS
jgi:hypothetical protein